MADAFKFPHETAEEEAEKDEAIEVVVEDAEVEVVDDTPPEDRGRKPMKEAPADVTDEELATYSEGVRKRIQHFAKGYHDERRAKDEAFREREEAVRLAKEVLAENERLKGTVGQGQAALLDQAKRTVTARVAEAKRKLMEAHEAFDTKGIVDAQEELNKATIQADRVNNFKLPALQAKESAVQQAPTPSQGAAPSAPAVKVDSKAAAWQEANSWFGTDDEMTAVALAVHRKLVQSGVDPTSDEYYDSVNSRVRKVFPDAFPSEKNSKKPRVVASATRSTAPRKIVLTQSQVNLARRLNLPLDVYARQVARESRNTDE